MKEKKLKKEKNRMVKAISCCLCLMMCFFSIPFETVFAGDDRLAVADGPGNHYVPVKPALESFSSDQPSEVSIQPAVPIGTDLPAGPLSSNPDTTVRDTPSLQPVIAPASFDRKPIQLNEADQEQLNIFIDNVINAAIAKNGTAVVNFLDDLSNQNYNNLADSHNKDPEIAKVLIDAFEDAYKNAVNDRNSSTNFNDYLQQERQKWQSVFQKQNSDKSAGTGAGDSQSTRFTPQDMERVYRPFAERIRQVVIAMGGSAQGSLVSPGVSRSSIAFFKNFSLEARELILKIVTDARENMKDARLSGSLEAEAFAAETMDIKGNTLLNQEMTLAGKLFQEKGKKWVVLDSVFLGADFFKTQKLLHPPAELHPYLKWLLYTRKLTPKMVENYLALRKKIMALYQLAKEGDASIRYRGKVYGAFLPFMESAGGNYELVTSVPVSEVTGP